MIRLPCECAYKIITTDPLGLSVKPGCPAGRAANKAGTAEMANHLGIGYATTAQAAYARRAAFAERPDVAAETFSYLLHDYENVEYEWDVVAAQRLANGRLVVMELLEPVMMALQEGAAEVDAARVLHDPTINPEIPCIAIPLPFPPQPDGSVQHVMIDGWHRAARGWTEGRTEFPLVILTAEDELAIRLRPSSDEIVALAARAGLPVHGVSSTRS